MVAILRSEDKGWQESKSEGSIIPHPLYSAQNHDYDVALLRLRTPLDFSGEALALDEQAVGCAERGADARVGQGG